MNAELPFDKVAVSNEWINEKNLHTEKRGMMKLDLNRRRLRRVAIISSVRQRDLLLRMVDGGGDCLSVV